MLLLLTKVANMAAISKFFHDFLVCLPPESITRHTNGQPLSAIKWGLAVPKIRFDSANNVL